MPEVKIAGRRKLPLPKVTALGHYDVVSKRPHSRAKTRAAPWRSRGQTINRSSTRRTRTCQSRAFLPPSQPHARSAIVRIKENDTSRFERNLNCLDCA